MAEHVDVNIKRDEEGMRRLSVVGGELVFEDDGTITSMERRGLRILAIGGMTPIVVWMLAVYLYNDAISANGLDFLLWAMLAILFPAFIVGGASWLAISNVGPVRVYQNGIAEHFSSHTAFHSWSRYRYYRRKKHWALGPTLVVGPWDRRVYFPESVEGFDTIMGVIASKLTEK